MKGGVFMQTRNVPKATLGRLPGYLKYLNEIKDELRSGAICEANAFINVVRGRADLRGRTNADVQE